MQFYSRFNQFIRANYRPLEEDVLPPPKKDPFEENASLRNFLKGTYSKSLSDLSALAKAANEPQMAKLLLGDYAEKELD